MTYAVYGACGASRFNLAAMATERSRRRGTSGGGAEKPWPLRWGRSESPRTRAARNEQAARKSLTRQGTGKGTLATLPPGTKNPPAEYCRGAGDPLTRQMHQRSISGAFRDERNSRSSNSRVSASSRKYREPSSSRPRLTALNDHSACDASS